MSQRFKWRSWLKWLWIEAWAVANFCRVFTSLNFAIAGGVALYVVANYSEARQELVCKGHWKGAPQVDETAYVELNEYRPWVLLWTNDHGNMKVQTDTRAVAHYFPDVERVFDGRLAMYSFHDFLPGDAMFLILPTLDLRKARHV